MGNVDNLEELKIYRNDTDLITYNFNFFNAFNYLQKTKEKNILLCDILLFPEDKINIVTKEKNLPCQIDLELIFLRLVSDSEIKTMKKNSYL